jgi:hypothetical protein
MKSAPIQETLTHFVSGFHDGKHFFWTGHYWVDLASMKKLMTELEAHRFVSRERVLDRHRDEDEKMNPTVEPLEDLG